MTTTYMFDKVNRKNIMSMQRQALSIIKSFFFSVRSKDNEQVLVGKPLFTVTPDKVTIQLFYYGTSSISDDKLILLGNALTRSWSLHVEVQVIRLNFSILDSSIFAQYLTHSASKYSFNRILDMLKNNLPTVISEGSLANNLEPTSHITGVKVRLSGRLTTQRSGPRQTVQAGRIGSSAKGPFSTVDYIQHTNKNKLGAFTMKVWISQQSQ